MKKRTTLKKAIAVVVICGGLFNVRPANAFIWPCIDITQISAFISSITTGVSTISNAFTQIKNAESTIASVGSQISSMKDFMSDLRKTIASIKEAVESVTTSVEKAVKDIKETVSTADALANEALKKLEEISSSTVENVNESVESGNSEEETQSIIEESMQEANNIKDEVLQTYDEALENINKTLDDANTSIGMLVDAVNTNENLSQEQKDELKNKAEDIKNDIEDLKADANTVINSVKDKYSEEYAKKVAAAYEEYSQAISDYFDGKISKDDLMQKGEAFKGSVASIDLTADNSVIEQFVKKADDIVNSIENLEEDILNTFSNDKEYSDEDDESVFTKETMKTSLYKNNQTYTFTYQTVTSSSLAKAIYSNNATGKPFLISQEFLCNNKSEADIENLKDNSAWFRTCVSRAKTELEYYPDAANDALYTKYQRNGVYNHITHDYSAANLVTISKMKQFAASWRGTVGNVEDSELYKLKKMIVKGDVDNQASGIASLSLIELWTPRLWSSIRRVDAIGRGKNVVKQFEYEDTLFIDNVNGRNPDVEKALSDKPGFYEDKKVFPNTMLSICNIKAEDISLDSTESEKGKQLEKEGKLKDCIYQYALNASKGGETGNEDEKKIWREKQKMVANDAAFENLTTTVINNYNSTKDYRPVSELKDGELNIVKLQEVVKGGQTAREHYGAGAQINYYATQQLLNIIDADAVNLQAEILKDLPVIDFSFFPKEEE